MAPELDEYPPPTWSAVAASWVFASVFVPLATGWYVVERVRLWLVKWGLR